MKNVRVSWCVRVRLTFTFVLWRRLPLLQRPLQGLQYNRFRSRALHLRIQTTMMTCHLHRCQLNLLLSSLLILLILQSLGKEGLIIILMMKTSHLLVVLPLQQLQLLLLFSVNLRQEQQQQDQERRIISNGSPVVIPMHHLKVCDCRSA